MVRGRKTLEKAIPWAAGAFAGALLVTLISGDAAQAANGGAATGGEQDPAVQMQIQQALSNFQVQMQTRMNMMQLKIDTLEREQQNMRFELTNSTTGRIRPETPIPADPIPGIATYGRLVSQSAEAERFVLNAARGDLLGQLAMTSDGPGLVLFDASGQISVALLATPNGPELRMVDADGTLQTVLSGQ
jgi:hypothetical protein